MDCHAGLPIICATAVSQTSFGFPSGHGSILACIFADLGSGRGKITPFFPLRTVRSQGFPRTRCRALRLSPETLA
jgi:hypothetical protein